MYLDVNASNKSWAGGQPKISLIILIFFSLQELFFSRKMKVVPNDEKIGFTILTGGRFNFAQKLCHFFFFHTIRNSPIEEGNFSTFLFTFYYTR